jgi:hypothetical protein
MHRVADFAKAHPIGRPAADHARRRRPPRAAQVVALALALVAGASTPGRAQESSSQFWPRLNVWVKPKGVPALSFLFVFAVRRDLNTEYTEGHTGPHANYKFNQHVSARVGYRYIWSISYADPPTREHRAITELTLRASPGAGISLVDRNRVDLRFIEGATSWDTSWRYRNRLRVERTFATSRDAPSRTLTPYAMEELGYDSRYDTFNRSRFTAGVEAQLTPVVMVDLNFVRQDDTRSSTRHLNALGLNLNLTY